MIIKKFLINWLFNKEIKEIYQSRRDIIYTNNFFGRKKVNRIERQFVLDTIDIVLQKMMVINIPHTSTGYPELDIAIHGMIPGNLYTLTGYPDPKKFIIRKKNII